MSAATDLYAVHQALAGESRAIPTGSCPTVGVAGLTLGGGLGADSRHAGLTCDALKSATVVLPGGDAVSASADDHAELFWALRGGGGGNFGVTDIDDVREVPHRGLRCRPCRFRAVCGRAGAGRLTDVAGRGRPHHVGSG